MAEPYVKLRGGTAAQADSYDFGAFELGILEDGSGNPTGLAIGTGTGGEGEYVPLTKLTDAELAAGLDDTLVAGSNITLTYNAGANTVTIAATGGGEGGGPVTAELVSVEHTPVNFAANEQTVESFIEGLDQKLGTIESGEGTAAYTSVNTYDADQTLSAHENGMVIFTGARTATLPATLSEAGAWIDIVASDEPVTLVADGTDEINELDNHQVEIPAGVVCRVVFAQTTNPKWRIVLPDVAPYRRDATFYAAGDSISALIGRTRTFWFHTGWTATRFGYRVAGGGSVEVTGYADGVAMPDLDGVTLDQSTWTWINLTSGNTGTDTDPIEITIDNVIGSVVEFEYQIAVEH